jgi:hypothetical protein
MSAAEMRYTEVLGAYDWLPLSEYVPDRRYVYVEGLAHMARYPAVAVARRGRHPLAYWCGTDGQPLSISVARWKPLPIGPRARPRTVRRQQRQSLRAAAGRSVPAGRY